MAVRGVTAQTLVVEARTLHREEFGLALTLVAVDKGESGAGSGHVAGAAPVKPLAPDGRSCTPHACSSAGGRCRHGDVVAAAAGGKPTGPGSGGARIEWWRRFWRWRIK